MKLNKFLVGVLGLMAFTACSSDEPLNNTNPTNPDEAAFGDNYLSVSLQMPTAVGSRADEDEYYTNRDEYDDGLERESKVHNILFFFFDENDNCTDVQMVEDPTFTPDGTNKNPYVTSYGTKEIRLKTGVTYKKLAVILNAKGGSAADYRIYIKTVKDLEDRIQDYINGQISPDGDWQVMSNSVYFDNNEGTASYKDDPKSLNKVTLVPIEDKNIYTSTEKPNFASLVAQDEKAYVDVYVERVVARVKVSKPQFNMENYYISKEGDTELKTITLFDNENLTTSEVIVKPVVKGMLLNVLTKQARLIKPINAEQLGYGTPDKTVYKDFRWNDPINKRSYWATTDDFGKTNMTYYSWENTVGKNLDGIERQYIHPNTQAFEPTDANENKSLNTKVMVVAELHKYSKEGDDLGTIDLVRYGSEYMLASSFLAMSANAINTAVYHMDWDNVGDFTPAERAILKVAVPNSFADEKVEDKIIKHGLLAKYLELSMLNKNDDIDGSGADYEAGVSLTENATYEITLDKTLFDDYSDEGLSEEEKVHPILDNENALNELFKNAKEHINVVITNSLSEINKQRVFYWSNGMTYFYTNIRHQGFYGLTGGKDGDYLNGVIRNHYYQISLDGIYGLGTPVIDPTEPIDPERPDEIAPSFINARINILPWRIVTNSATIH